MTDHAFEIVCRYDEAIDADAMTSEDKARFREEFDVSALAFIPGDRPARFFARRLSNSEMEECAAQPHEPARNRLAFSLALTRAVDVRHGDERKTWTRPTPKPLNNKALDEFDFADIQEVGLAIYARSLLGKGRPAALPLPPTSQRALEALVSRRVAQKMKLAAVQSSERAAGAGEAASSSPDGGTPGAATATGSNAPSP